MLANENLDLDLEGWGKKIVQEMYEDGMIPTWYRDKPEGWKLASGLWSPYYINLRLLSSKPKLYRMVGYTMGRMLKDIGFEPYSKYKVVGVAMAGIPIADAVSLMHEIPALYTRKLPEDVKTEEHLKNWVGAHGQHALVEGDMESGDRLAIVDDLVTKFTSIALAISQVKQEIERRKLADVTLKDVIVLLDREQGAAETARELGYNLRAVIPFISKGLGWLKDSLTRVEYETIIAYNNNVELYQDPLIQKKLKEAAQKK